MPSDQVHQRIIVGSDGSDGSRQAIDWALTHANPQDSIEIVRTWSLPVSVPQAGLAFDPKMFEDAAKDSLKGDLEFAQSQHPEKTNVSGRTTHSRPGAGLRMAAETADLLVVGTRGHGGFVGLLLGSTSAYLAHHTPCPLVIVPSDTE